MTHTRKMEANKNAEKDIGEKDENAETDWERAN